MQLKVASTALKDLVSFRPPNPLLTLMWQAMIICTTQLSKS